MKLTPQLRRAHLSHLRECWKSSLLLAERLVGPPRSQEPEDVDERAKYVFELALRFFDFLALDPLEFSLLAWRKRRKTRRRGRPR
ncbi:MAG: hypothetical protein DSO02_06780 [Hadesarchaea archaeon]|nr:MAG: hypothetical protein DSO02_06780 [Hadesarchaea archaeon]